MQLCIDAEMYTSQCSRVCLGDRGRAVLNARRGELHTVFCFFFRDFSRSVEGLYPFSSNTCFPTFSHLKNTCFFGGILHWSSPAKACERLSMREHRDGGWQCAEQKKINAPRGPWRIQSDVAPCFSCSCWNCAFQFLGFLKIYFF